MRLRCEDEGFLDFLAALLSVDAERRPTAAQALQHPWLAHKYADDGEAAAAGDDGDDSRAAGAGEAAEEEDDGAGEVAEA